MTATPTRLFYVDDSGSVDTGYVVYAWIETTTEGWRRGMRSWLDLRRELYGKYRIPISHEAARNQVRTWTAEPVVGPRLQPFEASAE